MTENEQRQIDTMVDQSFASLPADTRRQVVLSAFLAEELEDRINLIRKHSGFVNRMLGLHDWEQKNEKKAMAGMVAVIGVVALTMPRFFANVGQLVCLAAACVMSYPGGVYRRIKTDVVNDLENRYDGGHLEPLYCARFLPEIKKDLAEKFNAAVSANPAEKKVDLEIEWRHRNEFNPKYKGTWITGPLWD